MVRSMAFLCPGTERSSISQATGLTFPVVTKNVNELMSSGLLRETRKTQTRKGSGRIAAGLEVNPDYGWSIGIELGPYAITLTTMDAAGSEKGSRIVSKKSPSEYKDLISLLTGEIENEINGNEGRLLGIGITSPGGHEDTPGCLHRFDFPSWSGRPIEEDLKSIFGVPVLLMNNVTAMALYHNLISDLPDGHYSFIFALRGIASVEFIHSSNGLSNTVDRSGQVGHMILEINGEVCPSCGNRGCLESVSSETAVLKKCRERMAQEGIDSSSITMDDILSRRREDTSYMDDIFQKAFLFLSIAISNIQNYCHVDRMYIMSRMVQSEDEFKAIESTIRSNLLATRDVEVEFVRMPYEEFFGSKAAAFCLLYDTYVGIEKQLL